MTQTELELLLSLNGKLNAGLTAKERDAYLLGERAGLAYSVMGYSYKYHTIRVKRDKSEQAIQKLKGNNA